MSGVLYYIQSQVVAYFLVTSDPISHVKNLRYFYASGKTPNRGSDTADILLHKCSNSDA
jgi:hypothetical protein